MRTTSHTKAAHPVLGNVWWGVKYGFWFSVVLGLVVAVTNSFNQRVEVQGREIALIRILEGYLLGGLAGGCVLGLVRPLLRRRAAVIGVSALVGTVGLTCTVSALPGVDGVDILGAGIGGLLLGAGAGYVVKRD